jgi:hypothetical protein
MGGAAMWGADSDVARFRHPASQKSRVTGN